MIKHELGGIEDAVKDVVIGVLSLANVFCIREEFENGGAFGGSGLAREGANKEGVDDGFVGVVLLDEAGDEGGISSEASLNGLAVDEVKGLGDIGINLILAGTDGFAAGLTEGLEEVFVKAVAATAFEENDGAIRAGAPESGRYPEGLSEAIEEDVGAHAAELGVGKELVVPTVGVGGGGGELVGA